MLKGQKKRIDKEQGKSKHEAPRSVSYRATQNKNNIGTSHHNAFQVCLRIFVDLFQLSITKLYHLHMINSLGDK